VAQMKYGLLIFLYHISGYLRTVFNTFRVSRKCYCNDVDDDNNDNRFL